MTKLTKAQRRRLKRKAAGKPTRGAVSSARNLYTLSMWSPWAVLALHRDRDTIIFRLKKVKFQPKFKNQPNDLEWHGVHVQNPKKLANIKAVPKFDDLPEELKERITRSSNGVSKDVFYLACHEWDIHGIYCGMPFIDYVTLIIDLYDKFREAVELPTGPMDVLAFYNRIRDQLPNRLFFQLAVVRADEIPGLEEFTDVYFLYSIKLRVDIESGNFLSLGEQSIREVFRRRSKEEMNRSSRNEEFLAFDEAALKAMLEISTDLDLDGSKRSKALSKSKLKSKPTMLVANGSLEDMKKTLMDLKKMHLKTVDEASCSKTFGSKEEEYYRSESDEEMHDAVEDVLVTKPNREEMSYAVEDMLEATLSDIIEQLGDHFKQDLKHMKAEVQELAIELLETNMSDEEVEEQGRESKKRRMY